MNTLLVLNTNPALEESLVDYLLGQDYVSGFTSLHVYGHGHHTHMSIAEQVTGRRKRLLIQVILAAANVDELLAGLAENVGKDISYWQQAVHGFGHIE